jgi:hypothetical protein
VLARAPYLDEHLLIADLDLREVDRLRWRLPILNDERSDIQGPDEDRVHGEDTPSEGVEAGVSTAPGARGIISLTVPPRRS